jgi:hypothetical protein
MTTTADTPATTGEPSAIERMVTALADPGHLFTREQVAYLMATAARWAREVVEGEPSPLTYAAGYDAGYRARVAQENADWPPPPIYDAQAVSRWTDQVEARRQADRDARARRRDDHRGGPVPVWPATRPDPVVAGPRVPNPAGSYFDAERDDR